jgi:hypothetical protein
MIWECVGMYEISSFDALARKPGRAQAVPREWF